MPYWTYYFVNTINENVDTKCSQVTYSLGYVYAIVSANTMNNTATTSP